MEKLFKLIEEVNSISFSTVEDGKPKSRIFDVMEIRDNKIYFLTAKGKKVYKNLAISPYVALNGMNKNYVSFRLEGKITIIGDDNELRERLLDKNPMVRQIYKESVGVLRVLCIEHGKAEIYDLSSTLPKREFMEF